jgi:hypothetical protein
MNSICCYRETQVVPIVSVPEYVFDSPTSSTVTKKPPRIVYANECRFKNPLQMYCKPYRAPNTPKNRCQFGEKLCLIRKFRQSCCYRDIHYQNIGGVQTVSVHKIGFKMYCFDSASSQKCPRNYEVLLTPFGISCCYQRASGKDKEKSVTSIIPESIVSTFKTAFTLVDFCYETPVYCENLYFSMKIPGIDVWCCISISITAPTNTPIEETSSDSGEDLTTEIQSTTVKPFYFCNTTTTTTEKTFDPYDLIDIRSIKN